MMGKKFKFNISLSVLNHLGRNLYRNFATILGEAISNSWDADADNVYIEIKDNSFIIRDDGLGMDSEEFQNKFLRIGYSKRETSNDWKTPKKKRSFIGRKGIGKLALLSCSKVVHILSTKDGKEFTGGTINNKELDNVIEEDAKKPSYEYSVYNLKSLEPSIIDEYKKELSKKGTIIIFNDINDDIKKEVEKVEELRAIIALYFRFSLLDPDFKIHVNNTQIGLSDVQSLIDATEFVWRIGKVEDAFLTAIETKAIEKINITNNIKNFKGFIASTVKTGDLKIKDVKEKVGIDLYVNGRLRANNIGKEQLGESSTRVVWSYLYGQISFDTLESQGEEDPFTTSREGVKLTKKYEDFINSLTPIIKQILSDWDKFRRKHRQAGDPDNTSIPLKQRRIEEAVNLTIKEDYKKADEKFIEPIRQEAIFNSSAYIDCFISENLLRKYIKKEGLDKSFITEIRDYIDDMKAKEVKNKINARLSINISQSSDDINYVDMDGLAITIDPRGKGGGTDPNFIDHAKTYKPIRNAVMHTALITDEAKRDLKRTYDNIKTRIADIIDGKKPPLKK